MAVNGCIGRWNLDDPWTYPERPIDAKMVCLLRRTMMHYNTKSLCICVQQFLHNTLSQYHYLQLHTNQCCV